MTVRYQALDGTLFKTKEECGDYEEGKVIYMVKERDPVLYHDKIVGYYKTLKSAELCRAKEFKRLGCTRTISTILVEE